MFENEFEVKLGKIWHDIQHFKAVNEDSYLFMILDSFVYGHRQYMPASVVDLLCPMCLNISFQIVYF